MCGLIGIFGNIDFAHKELFEDLLRVDVIRGPHSTGIAFLQRKKIKPEIFKGTVLPEVLIANERYQAIRNQNTILLMGHNRWATTGNIEPENAHPFEHGNITLTHNGTIISKWRLEDQQMFDTDSEAITHSINKIGIGDTWKLIDGATALLWWDSKHQTLNVIRNDKRPFYYAYFENDTGIIWASETWMIKELATRKNIKLGQNEQIWYPPENYLYSFKFNQKKNKITNDVTELTAFKLPKPTPHTYKNHHSTIWGNKKTKKVVNLFRGEDFDNYDDIKEKHMNIFEFRQKYNDCLFCNADLYNHYENAVILSTHEAACGKCASLADRNNVKLV